MNKIIEFFGGADLIIFFLAGFAGMLVHWAKRWVRDETKASLYCYLFDKQPKYTALSVLTYSSAMAGVLAMGIADYKTSQSLAISFLAGYMIDSAINKDIQNDET